MKVLYTILAIGMILAVVVIVMMLIVWGSGSGTPGT